MSAERRPRVVVAGGGIGGIEAALALRERLDGEAAVTVVDPSPLFVVRATTTGGAVAGTEPDRWPMADVVREAGAHLTTGRLAAVDPSRHVAMLQGGELLTYDHLIVAVGARAVPHLPTALTFADGEDGRVFRAMLDHAVAHGRREPVRLVMVVPPGAPWPLVAYELALLTADDLRTRDAREAVEVSIVTSEDAPLAVFGPEASEAIARDLEAAGIGLHTGAVVQSWRWGRIEIVGADADRADRVVSLPLLRGPGIEGLPSGHQGFVAIGSDGSVPGAAGVWAIGDAAAFPLKQGGIACQQADSVAASIARAEGADVEPPSFEPVLRGWVWDGAGGRFVRSEAGGGREESAGVTAGDTPLWWPPGKVAGRYLAPFLAGMPAGAELGDRRP